MKLIKDVGRYNDEACAAIAKILIEYGAEVTAQDGKERKGRTALHYAKKCSLPKTLRVLQEHCPDAGEHSELTKMDSIQSISTPTLSIDADADADDASDAERSTKAPVFLQGWWNQQQDRRRSRFDERDASEEEVLVSSDEEYPVDPVDEPENSSRGHEAT